MLLKFILVKDRGGNYHLMIYHCLQRVLTPHKFTFTFFCVVKYAFCSVSSYIAVLLAEWVNGRSDDKTLGVCTTVYAYDYSVII